MNLVLKMLLLRAAAAAVLLQTVSSQQCRRSCVVSDVSKLRYMSGFTYEYELESESSVRVSDIESQQVQLRWSAAVELSFESPCEVSLQLKTAQFQEEGSDAFLEELTRWPMRAVVVDGTVGEVCADASDSTVAINIKKGILSAFQSSMPSHSSINNGIELEETDVIGICPTVYNVREESGRLFITKSKDHRQCSKRYGDTSESTISSLPLKSAIPMRTSKSKCVQESEDGIFKTVTCYDDNNIAPIFGLSRSVMAQQKFTLTYKKTKKISEIRPFQKSRTTTLLYDFTNSPKNSSAVQEVEIKLKHLCHIIEQGNVTMHTAQIFSDLISAMDVVEQSSIHKIWMNIKDKKYCSQLEDIEGLYLDAVAATKNDGAIPVLVQNILDSKRILQSAWRLHTIPRICSAGTKAVTQLLEQEDLPSFVTLAAGTVVNTYCSTEGRQNDGRCIFDENIEQLMQVASHRLKVLCPEAASNREKEKSTLVLLKTVGNMKHMTNELQASVQKCLLNINVPLRVRIEAAEVLRMSSLSEQDADDLLWLASSKNESTELRIFAYKAAVLHVSETELASFIDRMVDCDLDDQARAFILSDLSNLQFTEAPYKIAVKEKLARFNISRNYPTNISNTSRSFDVSKFTKSGSFGAEFLYDLIFDQQEKSVRQLRSNMTFDLFNELINVAEWGIRFENLPALLDSALNTEYRIGNTNFGKMLKLLFDKDGSKSSHGQLDFFLKTLGQEILFVSLDSEEDYESDLLASFLAITGDIYEELISEKLMHSVQAIQSRSSLEISTMQGIPLFYSRDLSAVGSLNSKANFVELGSAFEYAPALSVITNFFIGYNFGPSLGLKFNTTLHASSDVKMTAQINLPNEVSFNLDFPDYDAEVFYFENQGFLMTKMPEGPEQILLQSASHDPRLKKEQCFNAIAGLQICSEYDISDWWTETDYPLVAPSVIKTIIKKENPTVKGIEMSLSEKLHSQGYTLKIGIPGIEDSTKFSVEVDFAMQPNEKTIKIQSQIREQIQALELLYRSSDFPQQIHQLDVSLTTAISGAEKVISGNFSRSDRRVKMDLKTLGALRQVLLADVQVDFALGHPNSARLDRVEAVLGAGLYGVHARVGESQPSPHKRVYSSLLELTMENNKLLVVNSNSKYEAYSNRRFFSSLTDVEYKGSANRVNVSLENVPGRKLAAVEVTDVDAETPISFLLVDKLEQDARKSLVLIKVPQQAVDFKVSSRIMTDKIKFSVTSRGEELASIQGPFFWAWSQDSLLQKSQLGIRLAAPIRRSYHADTELEISEIKNKVQVTVNEDQQMLVSYLHDVTGDIESTLTAISKIELPKKIRTDFKFEKMPTFVKSEAELKLEVLSPQHVSYEVSIDADSSSSQPEGRVSAKIYWDKSRDPEQNLQFTGRYQLEDNSLFSLRGDVVVIREIYHYALSSSQEGEQSWKNFDSHLKLHVTQGSVEALNFMIAQRFVHEPDQQVEMDSEISLSAAGIYEYHFKNQLQAERLETGVQVRSNIGTHLTSVGTFNSVFNFNSRFEPDHVIFIQGEASASGLIEAKVDYKADLELVSPSIKTAEGFVELQVSGERLKFQMAESLPEQKAFFFFEKNDKKIFEFQLTRQADDSLTAHVQLPSNSWEVSGNFSNDEKSLIVYPDITSREFLFSAKLLNEYSELHKELKFVFEYLHAGRQNSVVGRVTANNSATEGQVSLDVFPSSDQVNVSLIAVQAADGFTHLEARLHSEREADGPRITLDITQSSQEKAIALVYKSKSDSLLSSLISARYIEQSPQSGVVSLLLKTPQKKFEVGGVLVREHSLACQGQKLNTTVRSPNGVEYIMEVTTCAPYFIKIISGAKDATEEKYIMKAGVKSTTQAELSLMKSMRVPASQWWQQWTGNKYEERQVPVVALSAELVAPQILALTAQYDRDTLAPTKSLILRELSSAAEAAFVLMGAAADNIMDDVSELLPDLRDALRSLSEAVDRLQLSQVLLEIKELFPELRNIKDLVVRFLKWINTLIDKLEILWINILDKLEEILTMLENLKILIDNLIQWLSRGNINLLLTNMWETLRLESLRHAVDTWMSYWTNESITALLPATLPDLINQTANDLSEYGKLLLEDSSFQFACSAAKSNLQKLRNLDSSHLLQYLFMASSKRSLGIFIENSTLRVNVPLSLPAASLLSAAQSGASVAGPHFPPGPPYSMTLDGDSVVTVRRDEVELPKSQCEYVLSKMKKGEDKVFVTFMNTRSSDLQVKYFYGKESNDVVVLGNSSQPVLVNGKSQPERFTIILGNMKIDGKPGSVKIRSPDVALNWDSRNLIALVSTMKNLGSYGSETYLKLYEVWCAASSVGKEVAAAAMRDLRRVWPDFPAVADEVASYWAAIFNGYAALSSNAQLAIRNSYHRVTAVIQAGCDILKTFADRTNEIAKNMYDISFEILNDLVRSDPRTVKSWFHSNGRNEVTNSTAGKQRVEALIDYVYNSIPPFWLSLKTFTLARVHQISHDVVAFWNLFKNYQFTQDALFLFRRCLNGIYSMNYSEVIQSVVSAALGQHYELRVRNSSVLLSVTLKRPASSLAAAAHLVFPARTSLPKLLVTALPTDKPEKNYTIVLTTKTFTNVYDVKEVLPKSGCEYILSRHHVHQGDRTTYNMAGYPDFSISFSYDSRPKHMINYYVKTKMLLVDGEIMPETFNEVLVPHEFFISADKDYMNITTPYQELTWHKQKEMGTLLSPSSAHARGVGWVPLPPNLSPQQVLQKIQIFKMDYLCVD
ncbi:Lipid transport protein N-terminal [Trinorchestia longiramus]|nr:Lipid transport protein N-terminal [Trinorchestia longiramus]